MEGIIANAEVTKAMVSDNIKDAQKRQKTVYDKKPSILQYVVGQRVLVQYSHKLLGISSKLQQKYDGPYSITKILPNCVYVVRHYNNKLLKSPVNAMRLRPYYSPDDRPTNPRDTDQTQITQTIRWIQ